MFLCETDIGWPIITKAILNTTTTLINLQTAGIVWAKKQLWSVMKVMRFEEGWAVLEQSSNVKKMGHGSLLSLPNIANYFHSAKVSQY